MIGHLDNWLAEYRIPFWEAIYLNDRVKCQNSLDSAVLAAASVQGTEDEREALQVYLQFLRYQLKHYFAGSNYDKAALARSELVSVDTASHGPLATIMQYRCSLTLRCWAHAMHGIVLPRAYVDKFYAEVPEINRDHQMMNYLSFWAFVTSDQTYMEKSYRWFLMEPVEFMLDFSRQRVKVMRAILNDELEQEELIRLFELMPHRIHTSWFEKMLMPVLQEKGMISEEAKERFGLRRIHLENQPPQVPPRRKEGKRINLNF